VVKRRKWVAPTCKKEDCSGSGKVQLTVYIALPRKPGEPATIQSLPGIKACDSCHYIYRVTKAEE
jgi:hypothetical protein